MVSAKVHEGPLPIALTVAQVAELIGVSRRQAYKLVKDGAIPSVRLGGSIRVPTDRFLEALEMQPQGRERHSPGQAPLSPLAPREAATNPLESASPALSGAKGSRGNEHESVYSDNPPAAA
jgi:excisionase family DNA binding protein